MRRSRAILGSFIFLLLAPGVVAGLVPWRITHWQLHGPFPGSGWLRIVGALLILCGVPMLLDSFARFAIQGMGTPAPVLPTTHLVVTGLYRRVRNPMYVGVSGTIFGQALLFGNKQLVVYGLLVWIAFHLFVVFYEEPTLRRTFGHEYDEFRAHVPRWIPRLHPWHQETRDFNSPNPAGANRD